MSPLSTCQHLGMRAFSLIAQIWTRANVVLTAFVALQEQPDLSIIKPAAFTTKEHLRCHTPVSLI